MCTYTPPLTTHHPAMHWACAGTTISLPAPPGDGAPRGLRRRLRLVAPLEIAVEVVWNAADDGTFQVAPPPPINVPDDYEEYGGGGYGQWHRGRDRPTVRYDNGYDDDDDDDEEEEPPYGHDEAGQRRYNRIEEEEEWRGRWRDARNGAVQSAHDVFEGSSSLWDEVPVQAWPSQRPWRAYGAPEPPRPYDATGQGAHNRPLSPVPSPQQQEPFQRMRPGLTGAAPPHGPSGFGQWRTGEAQFSSPIRRPISRAVGRARNAPRVQPDRPLAYGAYYS
jgi:hypothetical protein